jgi:membrane-bound lytic murein transglycosylase D
MAKNPSLYGLDSIKFDEPLEYDTLDIKQDTHLELIAAACDRPVADLRDMNPALLKPIAPAGYQMHVPKGSMNRVMAAIDLVPLEKRSTWKFHKVERGETAASIARKYNMQHASLAQANTTMSDEPEEGDLLLVPASFAAPVVAKPAVWTAPKRKPVLVRGRWVYPPATAPVAAAKRPVATAARAGLRAPVAAAKKPAAPKVAAKPAAIVPRNRRA